jgi:hypothetical protein
MIKVQGSELEREVRRLTEELEQAKEYEAEMVREVSDTGEAFAKLQSERAKALVLQTASDEKIQAAVRQCAAVCKHSYCYCMPHLFVVICLAIR